MPQMINIDTIMGTTHSTDPEFEWGQKRICNIYKPFNDNPVMAVFTPNRPVEVIVVDSGIMKTHQEFTNAMIEDLYFVPGFGSIDDDTGHGTALTSLIVGNTIGVNPNVKIKVVKIMGHNYTTTAQDIYDALDAILNYHRNDPSIFKVVLNSWQTPNDPIIGTKFQEMLDAGLCVVAAAGNIAENIDDVMPAGIPGVFTVAASTIDETELTAIYGVKKKLDIYAPGKDISVASIAGNDQYTSGTGSSNSAAFAAAVASIVAGMPVDMPMNKEVSATLRKDGTFGALTLNSKVAMRENVLLHRPDSTSINPDQDYYLGESKIGETIPLNVHLTQLLPIYSHRAAFGPLAYEFVMDGDASVFANSFTVVNDIVYLNLPPNFTLPVGEDIKQYSFQVKATGPALSMISPTFYFHVIDPNIADIETVRLKAEALTQSQQLRDLVVTPLKAVLLL